MSEPTENKRAMKENGTWPAILRGLLIAACSGALGYGASQQSIGREVADKLGEINVSVTRNIKDIESLKAADNHRDLEMENQRKQTDARIFAVADLAKTAITQTSEMIQLIKVQNELLRAKVYP